MWKWWLPAVNWSDAVPALMICVDILFTTLEFTCREIAVNVCVEVSTVYRIMQLFERTGSVTKKEYVTSYDKTYHSRFFTKLPFHIWIVAEFTVELMVEQPGSKKVPSPSYGLKIAHGSPVPHTSIFRETHVQETFNVSVYGPYHTAWFCVIINLPGKKANKRAMETNTVQLLLEGNLKVVR